MKIRFLLMAGLMAAPILSFALVGSSYTCMAQVGPSQPNGPVGKKNGPNKPPPTFLKLPDLVVMGVKSVDLDGGQVTVQVKNQGIGQAANSSVSLFLNVTPNPVVTKTAVVPALGPGEDATIVVEAQMLLSQVAYCLKADGENKIKESSEKNNKRCGKFGGKP